MKWKSHAQWPDGTISDDTHESEEYAQAVCRLLERNGFGGDGIDFPVRTWVTQVEQN
jgi:hypothetical protein